LGESDAIDQYQFRGLKKNGDQIWLEVFSKTINYGGRLADFVSLIDITEKKIAEKELKKSEKEYREAFNRTNFYKDLIAHDINNILQNILSSVELSFLYVEQGKSLKDIKPMLNLSEEQVSRGANLISNVRKLSELEEADVYTQPIEAIEVLNKSIEFLLKGKQDRKKFRQVEGAKRIEERQDDRGARVKARQEGLTKDFEDKNFAGRMLSSIGNIFRSPTTMKEESPLGFVPGQQIGQPQAFSYDVPQQANMMGTAKPVFNQQTMGMAEAAFGNPTMRQASIGAPFQSNAFYAALNDAKEKGAETFEVGGKKFDVK